MYSYGQASNADFNISKINYDLNGTEFIINYDNNLYNVSTSLIGEFNAYNACAAFAVSILFGVKAETAIKGIENTEQIPGRFEKINIENKTVIIDYSHTADSLEKALLAIKQISKGKRPVYTVFGCGGNRDKNKRPEMGKIAAELSDKVVITSDNPRDEEPLAIIKEIEEELGIKPDTLRKAIRDGRLTKLEGELIAPHQITTKSDRSKEDSKAPMGVATTNTVGRIEAVTKKSSIT